VGLVTDDRFAEFLRQAARDYNAPSDPPREEMWEAIAAARSERRPVRQTAVTPLRRVPVWLRSGAGIAAILLIGVAIGRFSAKGRVDVAGADQRPAAAAGRVPGAGDMPSKTGTALDGPFGTIAAGASTAESSAAPSAVRSLLGPPHAPQRFAESSRPGVPATLEARPPRSAGAYRAATLQHLIQAEVLLTSFRAESRSGAMDDQVALWARDLLSTTRLLLDSPAAADAQLKRLLDDLEVVLAQIAQLPAQRARGELDLIDEAVEQQDVITRLRSAIPAGRLSSGS
jgi:hypothetical protein